MRALIHRSPPAGRSNPRYWAALSHYLLVLDSWSYKPRHQRINRALALAHRLRPRDCGLYALMLMSCITLSFQVVSAKYIAKNTSPEDRATVFSSLHKRAWIAGIAIGLLLFLFEGPITRYLNLPDPVLISLLALGTAFYVPLGYAAATFRASTPSSLSPSTSSSKD